MASNLLQEAVRAAAADLKRRLLEPVAPPPTGDSTAPVLEEGLRCESPAAPQEIAPAAPAPTPGEPEDKPEDIESPIRSGVDRPGEAPGSDLPEPEDRKALESALGIAAPAPTPGRPPEDIESLIRSEIDRPGEAPKKVPPPAPSFAPPPPAPPAPVPAALPDPPSKGVLWVAQGLGFCWTGLIGVLTMADRAVPAPLKARKALLGKVGIAATLAAMLGLVVWACMHVAGSG